MTDPIEKDNHAKANAKSWLETIVAGMILLTNLSDGAVESGEHDGETFEDEDSLRERLEEGPLSVQVRCSEWFSPGAETPKPDEYLLLLTTGGPALRITGDLGSWGTPDNARLEYQDWGTPWTEYDATNAERAQLLAYANLMYYGEG